MNEIINGTKGNPIWKKITKHWYLPVKYLAEQRENKEEGNCFIQFVCESELVERNLEISDEYIHDWECKWIFTCKNEIIEIHEGGEKHFSYLQTPFGNSADYTETDEPLAEFIWSLLRTFDEEWNETRKRATA